MKHFAYSVVLLLLVTSSFAADRACVTVSTCTKAPIIDGKIGPDEWKDAAAVSGFLENDSISTSSPNSIAFITYDNENIYVAIRMPENKTGRPTGFVRQHDDKVQDDDCVRVYLAPEDLTKAKEATASFGGYAGSFDNWYTDIKAYYEFAINCKGSMAEAKNDVTTWDAPWKAKVSISKGYWTAEYAIPFASVGASACPINTLWGFNIFRNRPDGRSGWVNNAYGGYTPLPVGAILFTQDHPIIRQTFTTKPKTGANKLAFTAVNNTKVATTIDLTVTTPGESPIKKTYTLSPMGTTDIAADYSLGSEGSLSTGYDLRVAGEATPLLSGNVGMVLPKKLQTQLRYYSTIRQVWADIVLLPGSGAARAVLTVKGVSGELSKTEDLVNIKGTTIKVPLKGNPGDSYTGTLIVTSKDGKVLDQQTCTSIIAPKYSWAGTKAGLPLKVLPPWTPVKVLGNNINIVGRTLQYSDSALPAKALSAGKQMLSAPIQIVLRSNGKPVAWQSKTCKVTSIDQTQAKVESIWRSRNFDLRIKSTIDYDGFTWNEASIIPKGKQPVDAVYLDMPMAAGVPKYYCLGSSQLGGKISPAGLRTQFSISYNMWIGDERRGISLLTERVDWIKSKDIPNQVQVINNRWKTMFIDTRTVLSSPYNMSFALQYTPTKPVSLRKYNTYHVQAEWDMPTAFESGFMNIGAEKSVNLDKGTMEFWVKPTFDTNETYDPAKNRAIYNRQFFTLTTTERETLLLYYNADNRSFVLIRQNAAGEYMTVLGAGGGALSTDKWNYVSLTWGDKIRLKVNDTVVESEAKGLLKGRLETKDMNFNLDNFQIDDIRVSSIQRDISSTPTSKFTEDTDTLLLVNCENEDRPIQGTRNIPSVTVNGCISVPGRFGNAIGRNATGLHLDNMYKQGFRTVMFHENWSRYQGYPDLAQIPKLKAVADACHARGMRFVIYFNQDVSDATPEWKGMEYDFGIGGILLSYRREYDEIKQKGYYACVNGPFGDLLLDGIEKIAKETGIDGVYMDGTSVAWPCENPTHVGCGVELGNGKYGMTMPLRATRKFLMRLRNIFVQQGRDVYMSAHTGGGINIATTSLCDSYLDGEALYRYKKGYILDSGSIISSYLGSNYGYRGELIADKYTTDESLAVCLVNDIEMRWQPGYVTRVLLNYQDDKTRFIPYWDNSTLYKVNAKNVLASVYLKPDKALMVIGSQTEDPSDCNISVAQLLKKLPIGVTASNAITGETIEISKGIISLPIAGRNWKMIEFK